MSCWRNEGARKDNLHFDNQSQQVVFLFFIVVFSMFLSSYRNTRESLGEREKVVFALHNISRSPKLPLAILQQDRKTIQVFYFLITRWMLMHEGVECTVNYVDTLGSGFSSCLHLTVQF